MLPNNLMFTPATGQLTGIPATGTSGTYTLHFTAKNSAGSVTQTVTLSISGPPVVTTSPASPTVNAGQTVTLTAAARGVPAPTVQWQVSVDGGTFTNIQGATATTLSFPATAARNGEQFQTIFTNSFGTAPTSEGTLTVDFAPQITMQPASAGAVAGTDATFTAAANAKPTATVQWQMEAAGATSFTDMGNATSPTLTVPSVSSANNGTQYRAIFKNALGSTTTQAATLTVGSLPSITLQPSIPPIDAGQPVVLEATASGTPAPTVHWQVSTNQGTTFTNIGGAKSSTTLRFTAEPADNGNLYQAVFTNAIGQITTTPITLTVDFAPAITMQPTNQGVVADANAFFTAVASGNPTPTVQWQVKAVGTATFTDIPNQTSPTLTITSATQAESGNQYRAVFKNSLGSVTTQAATLFVGTAPTIATQPAAEPATAGQLVSFQAAANGTPSPTVQWQVSTNGGTSFTNIAAATSTTLSFAAKPADNGNVYQAVFTNPIGQITTTAVTLTVNFALLITTQPANQTVAAGSDATFTAAVNANPTATVQWEQEAVGATSFTDVSGATATSPALTVPSTTQSESGTQYRAVFSSSQGTVTTQAATLTVDVPPTITTSPFDTAVQPGQSVTFTAAASGTPAPSVQWQVSSDGTTFTNIPGATATTLTFTPQAGQQGLHYRAVFTNPVGSVMTGAVELVIW